MMMGGHEMTVRKGRGVWMDSPASAPARQNYAEEHQGQYELHPSYHLPLDSSCPGLGP